LMSGSDDVLCLFSYYEEFQGTLIHQPN
jgi:hypothetical protein